MAEQEKKPIKGRFRPGQSGNPGGRPAVGKMFRERCKEFMNAEGWDHLLGLARTPSKQQLPALELIAAYAYGKPTQPIDGDGEGGPIRVVWELPRPERPRGDA